MNRQDLIRSIYNKKSFLCVGLDTDVLKIPAFLRDEKDGILRFNKDVIDATKEYCVAYKINTAFYESMGLEGWRILEETLSYIPDTHFTIADAKRGDIGNTSKMYAKTFFETYPFDSITIAPYMGSDSVQPFLDYEGKWSIILALTSNQGASDFQFERNQNNEPLYMEVVKKCMEWGTADNLMLVTGATKASYLKEIRKAAPHTFFLVPGVGAQGGSLSEVVDNVFVPGECGLLVNSSRGIIYAGGDDQNFATLVRESAKRMQEQMSVYLD